MLLEVDNINVYYGAIHAIKGISFHVEEGEIVTLIGANGAGKTTTLNTISGLLRSKTGDVKFHDRSITHIPAHSVVKEGLALVPLSLYFKDSRVKVELGLCKGKKLHDKRDSAADREAKRDIDRAMKERNYR